MQLKQEKFSSNLLKKEIDKIRFKDKMVEGELKMQLK